jgi:hypothetical protein
MANDGKLSSDASQPTDHGDRVVTLRPRARARRMPAIDPARDPAWLRERRPDQAGSPDEEAHGDDDDRYRMLTNIIGAALVVILIGTGIWLAHAIADMRKMQDCVLSGRRNCAPVELPAPVRGAGEISIRSAKAG